MSDDWQCPDCGHARGIHSASGCPLLPCRCTSPPAPAAAVPEAQDGRPTEREVLERAWTEFASEQRALADAWRRVRGLPWTTVGGVPHVGREAALSAINAPDPAEPYHCGWCEPGNCGHARPPIPGAAEPPVLWSLLANAWDQGYIARTGDEPRYALRDEWPNPYREAADKEADA